MAIIECVPNISEGRTSGRAGRVRRRHSRRPVSGCSTSSLTRRTTAPCTRLPVMPPASRPPCSRSSTRPCRASTSGTHSGEHPAHGRRRRRAVHSDRGRDDGRLRGAGNGCGRGCRRPRTAFPSISMRKRPGSRHAAISRTSGAASSKVSPAKMKQADWAPGLRAERSASRAPAPRSSVRACRSSPTTSTSRPIGWTWRERSPPPSGTARAGLRFVKAMGVPLADRGIVQVSMNLTNYEKTPIHRVFELVKREAARYGVSVLESEIVGLVPAAAAHCLGRLVPAGRLIHGRPGARNETPEAELQSGSLSLTSVWLSCWLFLRLPCLARARCRAPASSCRDCCARDPARPPSSRCCRRTRANAVRM